MAQSGTSAWLSSPGGASLRIVCVVPLCVAAAPRLSSDDNTDRRRETRALAALALEGLRSRNMAQVCARLIVIRKSNELEEWSALSTDGATVLSCYNPIGAPSHTSRSLKQSSTAYGISIASQP